MIDRRGFLGMSSTAIAGSSWLTARRATGPAELDQFIRTKMGRDHIPGVAACLVRNGSIAWSNGYGWADLEKRIPMTIDSLQNIGSVSKTFTTTALLQQLEANRLQLDDDVSRHLPFPVRNPKHPDRPITVRLLLTHHSSIRDGKAYGRDYACGDPRTPLADWMRAYLAADGRDYDPAENFHPWAPTEKFDYCNVAYGLIAYLVEVLSGVPFGDYCRSRIFEPLGMAETSWYLRDIDRAKHAIPYTYVENAKARGPNWGGVDLGVVREPGGPPPRAVAGNYLPNCLYNHPNYPDGFLRTSVRQLSRYATAYLNSGALGSGGRILAAESVARMFETQKTVGSRSQGLTWYASARVRDQPTWGHGGSDPGINTDIRLLASEGLAAIAFMNTNGVRPDEISHRILELAPQL